MKHASEAFSIEAAVRTIVDNIKIQSSNANEVRDKIQIWLMLQAKHIQQIFRYADDGAFEIQADHLSVEFFNEKLGASKKLIEYFNKFNKDNPHEKSPSVEAQEAFAAMVSVKDILEHLVHELKNLKDEKCGGIQTNDLEKRFLASVSSLKEEAEFLLQKTKLKKALDEGSMTPDAFREAYVEIRSRELRAESNRAFQARIAKIQAERDKKLAEELKAAIGKGDTGLIEKIHASIQATKKYDADIAKLTTTANTATATAAATASVLNATGATAAAGVGKPGSP